MSWLSVKAFIGIPICCLWLAVHSALAAGSPSVASINLCADQLLVLLAEPGQIKTLSNLSHDEAGSYYFKEAKSYAVNAGHAEQILPLQPDLVIAGQYSPAHTINLLREVGLQVEILPIANSVDEVFENIRKVANWLGRERVADELITGLKRRIAKLETPLKRISRAAVYDPNGFTVGAETLRGEIMLRAGWTNVASEIGIESYGQLSLESLIKLAPDALIESPYSPGTYSRGQALSQHPALREAGLKPRVISVPSRMTICAGPWTLDVIEQLQTERMVFESERFGG